MQATPLRFGRLWNILGIGFVLLVIYLSLTPELPDIAVSANQKVGHVLAYGWLMLWFAQIYRSTRTRVALAAAFCALGVALEYVQGMTGFRGFEYSDMLLNSAGVAVGLALACSPLQNGLQRLERMLSSK